MAKISQKAADLAENLLEDLIDRETAKGGRVTDVFVAGRWVRVTHRMTIERMPA